MKNSIIFILLVTISNLIYSQGNALNFDGIDDEIDATVPTLSGDDITIQLWAKPNASQLTYANIVDTHTGGGVGYTIEQNVSVANEYYFAWGSGSGAYNIPLTFTLTPNIWQHLSIVKSSNTLKIYINGIETQSVTGGNPTLDPGTSLRVGNFILGSRNWGGCLDEVRIWDKALTSVEVSNNYNIELVGNETDLILYYDFNQGIAEGDNGSGCPGGSPCEDTAIDNSASGNTGNLNNFNLSGLISNWVNGFGSTVPIELISFNGYQTLNEVILNWRTATETSNLGFNVLHSTDGINWFQIGFVKGSGNSNHQLLYTFDYQMIKHSENYFRLKQIDFDGNFSFSNIINFKYRMENSSVFPNPFIDIINLPSINGKYYLKNINGQIIYRGFYDSSQLDLRHLSSGTYHLVLERGNLIENYRLLKL